MVANRAGRERVFGRRVTRALLFALLGVGVAIGALGGAGTGGIREAIALPPTRTSTPICPDSPRPHIVGIHPAGGEANASTTVTLTGVNFTKLTSVTVDGHAVQWHSLASQISLTVPPGTPGAPVDIVVMGTRAKANPDYEGPRSHQPRCIQSPVTTTAKFMHFATGGSAPTVASLYPLRVSDPLGGTPVTIYGTRLQDVFAVGFGDRLTVWPRAQAPSGAPMGEQAITVAAPTSFGGPQNTVDVIVTTKWGESAVTSADRITYAASCPTSKLPLDLVYDEAPGGVMLNPRWCEQDWPAHPGGLPERAHPDPIFLCNPDQDHPKLLENSGQWNTDPFSSFSPSASACTHVNVSWDSNEICNTGLTVGQRIDYFPQHVNWGAVAKYEGWLVEEEFNSEWLTTNGRVTTTIEDWPDNPDPDFDFNLEPPNAAGVTAAKDAIHLEFDSEEVPLWKDETQQLRRNAWWYTFLKGLHDNSIRNPGKYKKTDKIVGMATGLIGLDCGHDCYTELHPIYTMALNYKPDPADDAWAFFGRNWGDEGVCSDKSNVHVVKGYVEEQFSVPWRAGATSVDVDCDKSFVRGPATVSDVTVHVVPGHRVDVRFPLGQSDGKCQAPPHRPRGKSSGVCRQLVWGEVHLKWKLAPGVVSSNVGLHRIPPTAPTKESKDDEGLAFVGLLNRMTPAQRTAFARQLPVQPITDLENALPKACPKVVIDTPSMPQTTPALQLHVPTSTPRSNYDTALHGALCKAFNDKVPNAPKLCAGADFAPNPAHR